MAQAAARVAARQGIHLAPVLAALAVLAQAGKVLLAGKHTQTTSTIPLLGVAAAHLPLAQTLGLNSVALAALEHHHQLPGQRLLMLVAGVAAAMVPGLEILRVLAVPVGAELEASVQQQGQMGLQILAAVAAAAEMEQAMVGLVAPALSFCLSLQQITLASLLAHQP